MHKWVVLAAAVAMQACLGGIYAWSVFVPSLQAQLGLSMRGAQAVFGGCVLVFTLTMIVSGKLLPVLGPRVVAGLGGVFFGLGYLLASFAEGFFCLFAGVALLSGMGIGMAYVCPIVTCMKWFPHSKGLVTGMTVAGFGGGAVLLSNWGSWLIDAGWGVSTVFRIIGIGYGLLVFAAAMCMDFPRGPVVGPAERLFPDSSGFFRRRSFWLLALGVFCGTFAGLVVIGALESIGELWKLPHAVAVGAVSSLAVGNAFGRIAWGWLFDRFGMRTLAASLLFLAVAMGVFQVFGGRSTGFLLGAAMIGFGFGACFVVYAGAVAKIFGTDKVGVVYPFIFLFYGLSAIVGPSLGGTLYDIWGSYGVILLLSTVLPLLAAAVLLVYPGSLARH